MTFDYKNKKIYKKNSSKDKNKRLKESLKSFTNYNVTTYKVQCSSVRFRIKKRDFLVMQTCYNQIHDPISGVKLCEI